MYVGVATYLSQIAFMNVVFHLRLNYVHLKVLEFSQDKLLVLLNLYDISIVKIVLMVICY